MLDVKSTKKENQDSSSNKSVDEYTDEPHNDDIKDENLSDSTHESFIIKNDDVKSIALEDNDDSLFKSIQKGKQKDDFPERSSIYRTLMDEKKAEINDFIMKTMSQVQSTVDILFQEGNYPKKFEHNYTNKKGTQQKVSFHTRERDLTEPLDSNIESTSESDSDRSSNNATSYFDLGKNTVKNAEHKLSKNVFSTRDWYQSGWSKSKAIGPEFSGKDEDYPKWSEMFLLFARDSLCEDLLFRHPSEIEFNSLPSRTKNQLSRRIRNTSYILASAISNKTPSRFWASTSSGESRL
ncbi:hypothetical protein HK096_011141, partial [Nowakowskiella sp. JEL0078]